MKKTLITAVIVAVLATAFIFVFNKFGVKTSDLKEIYIGNSSLTVELAQSQGTRGQGLGGKKSLPQNQGMLFVFDGPGINNFWTRDMEFSIDIIWADADYKIAHIERNLVPESYPKSFGPNTQTQYVIETNSGWADSNNIKIGDMLIMPWKYEEKINAKEAIIKVNSPEIGAKISSPLAVDGEARGNWFFEASFPVKITDSNGNELAVKPATANDNWMTTEFVPFSASLEFTPPKETDIGFLILKKDNPSGFSENDDQIEIPIRFR